MKNDVSVRKFSFIAEAIKSSENPFHSNNRSDFLCCKFHPLNSAFKFRGPLKFCYLDFPPKAEKKLSAMS